MRPLFPIPFLFLLFLGTPAWAATIKLTISPEEIYLGESAELNFIIAGNTAEVAIYKNSPPDFSKELPGVRVIANGRKFSFSNQSQTLNYVYSLTPPKLGTYTLAPKPMPVGGGKNIRVAPVTVKVIPRPAADKRNNEFGVPRDTPLFVRVIPSETNLVPQQVTQVDILIYTLFSFRPETIDIGKDLRSTTWDSVGRARTVNAGGKRYTVVTLRGQVWSERKGTFNLAPTVRGLVTRPVRNRFVGRSTRETIPLARPIPLTVSALPTANRPASFQDGVGDYALNCTINAPDNLRVGDPINLSMTVTARGSALIKRIAPPQSAIPSDDPNFRLYETRLKDEKLGRDNLSGSRTWEQVIEATSTNVTEIPPVRFAFYNPKAGRYLELVKGPFPITVTSDIADRSAIQRPAAGNAPGRAGRIVNQDLLFLKPLPSRWRPTNTKPWYLTLPFLASSVIPVALLLGTVLFTRRRNTLRTDVAKARRLHAPKAAKAGIADAETALAADHSAFYEGIARALADYFGNRLNLPPGAVTADRVATAFPRHADAAHELFAACESQRFGGGTTTSDDAPTHHLNQLKTLFRDCEKENVEASV